MVDKNEINLHSLFLKLKKVLGNLTYIILMTVNLSWTFDIKISKMILKFNIKNCILLENDVKYWNFKTSSFCFKISQKLVDWLIIIIKFQL